MLLNLQSQMILQIIFIRECNFTIQTTSNESRTGLDKVLDVLEDSSDEDAQAGEQKVSSG